MFDVDRGPGSSFRPWDHQLRRPLYIDQIDPQAEYGLSLTRLVAIAELVAGEVAAGASDGGGAHDDKSSGPARRM
ncbi:MAG TPA: hypothetical protein VF171_01945 [Trueperaceae bacterium]